MSTPRSRRRSATRAAALLLPAVLAGGCAVSNEAKTRLAWVGEGSDDSYGIALPVTDAGTPVTVLAGRVCRRGDEEATTTAVAFEQSEGLEVVGFATRERVAGSTVAGSEELTLTEAGYDPSSRRVATDCSPSGNDASTDLAIEVRATATGRVRGSRLSVTYTTPSGTQTMSIPVTLVLCVGAAEGETCRGE